MSRIGKKPIKIPQGVEVKISDDEVKVKGPKGELQQKIVDGILVEQKENELVVSLKRKTKDSKALWGLYRALLQNSVQGVTEAFEKQLEIVGVGYKAALQGKSLKLDVGFSHPVILEIPEGLNVTLEKNIITILGIDRQKVGQFAAKVRASRPPEPYKGKGIRYVGEKVRKKEGKKVVSTGT